MAMPNFSELTFAFAYLRELEARSGPFAVLPDFISQHSEATKGYDLEVAYAGTVAFLQFKRSEVMTRSTAREIANGDFSSTPVYRMHLHKHHAYAQHAALQRLEDEGNVVFYVTTAAPNRTQLLVQAQTNALMDRSVRFLPSEITLPDLKDHHYVSFVAGGTFGVVYSEQGERFERRVATADAFGEMVAENRRSAEGNKALLSAFLKRHTRRPDRPVIAGEDGLWAKAATLARLRYDLELVILK